MTGQRTPPLNGHFILTNLWYPLKGCAAAQRSEGDR